MSQGQPYLEDLMMEMTKTEPLRKSSQEVEIDHLLAEEFECDPSFGERFLSACSLPGQRFRTVSVLAEPSLGGDGFGDLLVHGEMDGHRVALLIEDKITAGPATRQAERYAAHASRMLFQGWDRVWCILVAPKAYIGERSLYDAGVDLETVAGLLQSSDPVRLAYRQGIISRAVSKRAASGVRIPDLGLHQLKSDYLDFVAAWCAAEGLDLTFPTLRQSYYDGDSWIEPIRHPNLPAHVYLRHRLWVSVAGGPGQVDLIAKTADEVEQTRFKDAPPEGAIVAPFSKHGVQVSLRLPQMRQSSGFDADVASKACEHMRELVTWYVKERPHTAREEA